MTYKEGLSPERLRAIADGVVTMTIRTTATYPVRRGKVRHVFEGEVVADQSALNIKVNRHDPISR
jgi:hypothetical protein